MEEKLSVGSIISNGMTIGIKSFVPLLVNGLLAGICFIIPYINIGTTIGIYGLVPKMGRDEGLSNTEVLNPEYRKYMGEFFLVMGFMTAGIFFGMMMMFVGGLVISMAWMLAPYLVLDKGMNPIEALKKSNDLTYGSKFTIFLSFVVLEIGIVVAIMVVGYIGGLIHSLVQGLLSLAIMLLIFPILLGCLSYIYNTLTKDM